MDKSSDGHDGNRGVVKLALNFVLQWDLDRYVELFDAAAVMESPFAPPGFPGRMEGKVSIERQLAPLWKRAKESGRRFKGYDPLRIYETAIPGLVIAEFRANGEVEATGERFWLDYIHVYRIRAGKIVSLRDYWSPIAIASLPNASSGNARDTVAVDAAELQ